MTQLLIIGVIMILLALGIMIFSHSQSLQRFAVMEFLLVLLTSAGALFGLSEAGAFMKEQYFSLFQVYIGEAQKYAGNMEKEVTLTGSEVFWQEMSDELGVLLERTLPVTQMGSEEIRYLTAAVCERSDGEEYTVKLYRKNREGYLSEAECLDYVKQMADKAVRLGGAVYEETEKGSGVLVYTGSGIAAPGLVFLTEIPLEPLKNALSELQRKYMIGSGIFWLAGTLALALVISLQGRQLRSLVKTAARVAEGKENWEALQDGKDGFWIESNEIRGLKNSLGQIAADIARINYMKYKVLQGYYRFAPKQIEKILGKNSILEVETDDRVSTTGTLAFVVYPEDGALRETEYLKRRNLEYEELSEKREEYGGIWLSANSDLTTMQLLFQEETKRAVHFGIDLSMCRQDEKKEPLFVLLHRASFVYGVAGSEEQAFTYVLSKEMKRLEKYAARFRAAGIRMAVTDAVYENIAQETTGRYIGYLEEENDIFKLYEILDAYPAKERKRRLDTKGKFEKALNLFYQGDYYLGRNLFTEVLKECPEDEVAKGYLFLCEKCLNTDYGKDISCALFSD